MRALKTFGLALLAATMLSGVAAPLAFSDDLDSEFTPVQLTGAQEVFESSQFLTTAGTVSCTQAKYTATVATPTTSAIVTPSYSGCTTSGLPSEVQMNGCTYRLNVGGGTTGFAEFACPFGAEATITVTGSSTVRCTIHVPAQNIIGGFVTYTNIGAGTTKELTVQASLSSIDYTHTKGSGLGACTPGSALNGTLNARAVVTGEIDGGSAHLAIFMK